MQVDLYERLWMWLATVLIAIFIGTIAVTTGLEAIQPPSHLETIDPESIDANPEFGDPKVTTRSDGSVVVSIVAAMFSFTPDPIEIPAGRPVTFRVTSRDVIHGFEVVGTNANTMVVPGYVSQFTVTFDKPGTYTIACNEYCGIAHHMMVGTLTVK
ncbi:MAG TPA: cytochrome c oxidase subunit II [Vicinamibacterales bacterium]|nr:cytochrome c oxidase subunit II [Vicinamibacterales bacterium]